MEAVSLEPARRTALRPWLLILLTAPIVVAALGWLAYRWQARTQNIARLSDHFIQRQNAVLAHDATRVSHALSTLLEQAARDARVFASVPADPKSLERVFAALGAYNRLAVLTNAGKLTYLADGRLNPSIASLQQCRVQELCDGPTLQAALKIPVGKSQVGKGLRWYTPEKEKDQRQLANGTLSVAYRAEKGVYLVGIDFRALLEIIRLPTFPYEQTGELLEDYENGNYIYLLDQDSSLLAHPKTWHMMGMDPKTGLSVPPMRNDADAGTRPLNFRAYQEGVLRPYFDRLFDRSFKGTDVDIFQAANLSGMTRVVSIAPVFLNKDIFEQKGAFGYVGVGCALEHFQEPEERLVPYY